MSWVRLDDTMPDHEKLNEVSAEACWLHVCGIAFCSRNLTDGFVDKGKVGGLLAGKKSPAVARRLVAELVEAGLWETRGTSRYEIHDYLKYNPSKEQVLARREANRLRVEKARAAKLGNASGNALHKGIGNALHDPPVTPLVTPSVTLAPAPTAERRKPKARGCLPALGDVTDVAPRLTVAEADEEQLKAVNLLVSRGSSEAGALELVGAIGAAAVFTKLEEPA